MGTSSCHFFIIALLAWKALFEGGPWSANALPEIHEETMIQDLLKGLRGTFGVPVRNDLIIEVGYDLDRLLKPMTSLGVTKKIDIIEDSRHYYDEYTPEIITKFKDRIAPIHMAVSSTFHTFSKKLSWKAMAEKDENFWSVELNKHSRYWKFGIGREIVKDKFKILVYPTKTFSDRARIPYAKMVPETDGKFSPGINLGNGEFSWDYAMGLEGLGSNWQGAGVRVHWRAGQRTTLDLQVQSALAGGQGLLTAKAKVPFEALGQTTYAIIHEFQINYPDMGRGVYNTKY